MFYGIYIYICALLLIGNAKCDLCREIHMGEEVYAWSCTGSNIYRVPAPLRDYDNYEFLFLQNCPNLKLNRLDFRPFINVHTIYLSNISMDSQRHNVSLETFKNLFSYNVKFYFESSGLDDKLMWILPARAHECSFRNNNYTRLDVSSAENLEIFIADQNKLNNLPKVFNESAIKSISLFDNPLNNLTVKDLAPFCNLKQFNFTVTSDSYLITEDGKCVCEELRSFAQVFGITGFQLICIEWSEMSLWKQLKGCSINLARIKDIRAKCGDSGSLGASKTVQYIPYFKLLFIVIFAVLLLLLLISALYFVIFKRSKEDQFEGESVEEGLSSEEETPEGTS